MTAVDLEEQEPFWRRHLGVLILGAFATIVVVIALLQLLEEGDIAEWLAEAPKEWAYVLCFGLVWLDAVIPIFPGETTLSAASTLAAQGELELVMLAGALGAIVGDSSLFWIARKSAAKVKGQLDSAGESEGSRRLGRSRPLAWTASLITSAALAAIYFVDRRRRRAAKGAVRLSSAGSDE